MHSASLNKNLYTIGNKKMQCYETVQEQSLTNAKLQNKSIDA